MPGNSQLGCSNGNWMFKRLARLFSLRAMVATQGQDLIEYALMVGFVAVAAGAFIPYSITGPVSTIFNKIGNFLTAHANG